jgi:hypothetical protein
VEEGVPSGIRIETAGGIRDMYRFASLPEEIEVRCIDRMDRFDVEGVVFEAGSVEGELRKETT